MPQVGWLAGWLAGGLAGEWLAGGLAGWLANGWLVRLLVSINWHGQNNNISVDLLQNITINTVGGESWQGQNRNISPDLFAKHEAQKQSHRHAKGEGWHSKNNNISFNVLQDMPFQTVDLQMSRLNPTVGQ